MTIANTNVKSVYNANGVTREWNLGFAYNSNMSSLSIVVKHDDGTSTTVTTNYELDGNVLTYPTVESELDPLPVGDVIVISRVTPLTQTINLVQQGPLDAETLESGYDKLTLEVQEVKNLATEGMENITTVANHMGAIDAVAANTSNINIVASNNTDISTVADSITDVNAVSESVTNINTISDNLTNIDTVAGISSNVTTVASMAPDISDVVAIKTDIEFVAENETIVTTVANNSTNITTVANNINNVNTAASNMSAIIAAPTQASNAQKWAEGSDADVTPLGGTHSSKGWAQIAQESAGLPLFYHTFADHLLNNASWLRADTFSWQSGAVYVSAYNHLVDDIDGITSETETVAGTTITFKRATDGHKIVDTTQASNVEAIYTATGVAWYYILDTANTRFKLPRKNLAKEIYEVHPEVLDWENKITWNANSVAPSSGLVVFGGQGSDQQVYLRFIPSGETTTYSIDCGYNNDAGLSGTFVLNAGDRAWSSNGCGGYFVPFKENITRAEDYYLTRYLYFYVGNTVQDQTTIDVGEITEALNDKAENDLSNLTNIGKQAIVTNAIPDYANGVTVGPVNAGTYTQVMKDSFVVTYGTDPFMEDYKVYVSPDNGTTQYIVGMRYDNTNSATEGVSFSFFVPKGWYFTNAVENGYTAHIYPLKGAQ